MAWISIHEQVLGGKLRKLSKKIGCSQNEALGMLVKFWLWGINNAKKDGRIDGADESDIEEIINIGISKDVDPEEAVKAMIDTQWIDLEEDGLYIHDWEEWQGHWYKAIESREKDKERKRRERAAKKEAQKKVTEKNEEKDIRKENANEASKYSSNFEKFWLEYPRKIGKGEAYKKYNARIKDGWKPEELEKAARNYADKCARDHTEKQYIKHGKNFLSDSTPFTDYLNDSIVTENDKQQKNSNSIHNFTQRDYDFDALEQQLLKKQMEG